MAGIGMLASAIIRSLLLGLDSHFSPDSIAEKNNHCSGRGWKSQPTNSRIGDLTLNFQSSKFKTFPFPGDLIIYNSVWTDSAFDTGIGINNCINFSKKGSIIGKDCKGNKVITTVCNEGFMDGSYGMINRENIQEHGWIYLMAFPELGVNPGCPDPGKKAKKALEFRG
ncbi:uncharacterized protein BDR25DRAFT_319098 [Lindgomyces ingoldianus]|uniref:Uncharacterized protein n=1 Tax=Lindgomyces ingoldianus TaxID=673940 RepID=A0ACB6QCC0_9PLEO|nr:uncharacterized protein BDR25DRAFT_319098 [Lindgomyces ingoldianus]KAF2464574.1 hypothetical protein BDR25DRAFT_319098 [Lindgomyces ingoldianus]